MAESARDRRLVRAIIGIAADLGMSVTAEGVETAEQRDALVALGCLRGQGWLFGRPVPAARFLAVAEAGIAGLGEAAGAGIAGLGEAAGRCHQPVDRLSRLGASGQHADVIINHDRLVTG